MINDATTTRMMMMLRQERDVTQWEIERRALLYECYPEKFGLANPCLDNKKLQSC